MSDTISFISVVAIFVVSMAIIYWLKRETKRKLLDIQFKLLEEYSSWRKDDFAQIKKLKAELDSLSIVNQDLVNGSKANSERLENELMYAKHKTKEIQERYSDYCGKAEQLTLKHLSTISELQGKLAGATQEIEQLKAQLAVNVQALKELSFGGIATGVISKSDYDRLKQEYDLTTKNMVQWMTKCSQLEAEIAELKTNDYSYLVECNENLIKNLGESESRLSHTLNHVRSLLAENSTLKLQLTGMASMRSQIMFAVDDTLQQKSASIDELKKKHAEEIDNQRMNWDEHVKQKDDEITHLKQVLSDTVTTLNERYSSIVQENEKLKTDNDWLQKECKKLQDEVDKPIKVIWVDENNNPLE